MSFPWTALPLRVDRVLPYKRRRLERDIRRDLCSVGVGVAWFRDWSNCFFRVLSDEKYSVG